jgi:hypothetical protein
MSDHDNGWFRYGESHYKDCPATIYDYGAKPEEIFLKDTDPDLSGYPTMPAQIYDTDADLDRLLDLGLGPDDFLGYPKLIPEAPKPEDEETRLRKVLTTNRDTSICPCGIHRAACDYHR